jgi:hypothetical protein
MSIVYGIEAGLQLYVSEWAKYTPIPKKGQSAALSTLFHKYITYKLILQQAIPMARPSRLMEEYPLYLFRLRNAVLI